MKCRCGENDRYKMLWNVVQCERQYFCCCRKCSRWIYRSIYHRTKTEWTPFATQKDEKKMRISSLGTDWLRVCLMSMEVILEQRIPNNSGLFRWHTNFGRQHTLRLSVSLGNSSSTTTTPCPNALCCVAKTQAQKDRRKRSVNNNIWKENERQWRPQNHLRTKMHTEERHERNK